MANESAVELLKRTVTLLEKSVTMEKLHTEILIWVTKECVKDDFDLITFRRQLLERIQFSGLANRALFQKET
jgi:hypothetical protein